MGMHENDTTNRCNNLNQPFLKKIVISFLLGHEKESMCIECLIPDNFQKGVLKFLINYNLRTVKPAYVNAAKHLNSHSSGFLLEVALRDGIVSLSIEQKSRIILLDCSFFLQCQISRDSLIYLAGKSLDDGAVYKYATEPQDGSDDEEIQGYGFMHWREGSNAFLIGSLDNDLSMPRIVYDHKQGTIILKQHIREFRKIKETTFVARWGIFSCSLEQCYRLYFSHLNVQARHATPFIGFSRKYSPAILGNSLKFKEEIKTICNAYDFIQRQQNEATAQIYNLQNAEGRTPGRDMSDGVHVVYHFESGFSKIGDWESLKGLFKRPEMRTCLDMLKDKGIGLGMTYLPLLCEEDSDLFFDCQDWCLRDSNGSLIFTTLEHKRCYVLDLNNVEVRSFILQTLEFLVRDLGVDCLCLEGLNYAAYSARVSRSESLSVADLCILLKKGIPDEICRIASGLPLQYHALLKSIVRPALSRYEFREAHRGAHVNKGVNSHDNNDLQEQNCASLEHHSILDITNKYYCGVDSTVIRDSMINDKRRFFLKKRSLINMLPIQYRPAKSYFYDMDLVLSEKFCLNKELARVIAYMNV